MKVNQASFKGWVLVEYNAKLSKYMVISYDSITGKKDRIFTPYEIFHAETGDINHDDKPDILLGIIKPTPFDSVLRKRLFIFQIDRDYIRPLWLGSKVRNPLELFCISGEYDKKQTIITLEQQSRNLFCIREYEWDSFGLYLVRDIQDSLKHKAAYRIFKNYKRFKI